MTIASDDDLKDAFGNTNSVPWQINKATVANQLAGGWTSLWRATGVPAQGAIPSTVAVCDKTLTGAFNFTNGGGADYNYIGHVWNSLATAGQAIGFFDRLSHMGGLSGVTTGNQTVNVDASAGGLSGRCNQGTGAQYYNDVMWFAEIYTDIGTTAQTCTVTYTNAAGTSGQTLTFSLGGASPANRAGRMFPLIPANGEFIKSIQTVSIGTSTGTAGSWGITAMKQLTVCPGVALASKVETYDWAALGLPLVPNDGCIMIALPSNITTSSGVVLGGMRLVRK
jgi:hypothetical protein